MNKDRANRIFNLFSKLVPPGENNIAQGNSIEAGYVNTYFKKFKWQELSVDHLQGHYPGDPAACLSFMTPVSFRYFFPGFMKMAFLEYESADAIFDVVVNKLAIVANEPNSELRSIFEKYDYEQLAGIAEFLQLLSESICRLYPVDFAILAINSYWGRYLNPPKCSTLTCGK